MTPEDLTPYIEQAALVPDNTICTIDIAILRGLCDALEAAWAERDRYRRDAHTMGEHCNQMRERAERAEAENATLVEAVRWMREDHAKLCRHAEYEKKLARAEELVLRRWDYGTGWPILEGDWRAAIEGDKQ